VSVLVSVLAPSTRNSLLQNQLRMEARVGIEGRPPSALLLRAQYRPYNTGWRISWQDRSVSAPPRPFHRSFTEEFTEGKRILVDGPDAKTFVAVSLSPGDLPQGR
jgi:hypothetical protein